MADEINDKSGVSETFCVLPFSHLATYTDGSALLCCVAQNDLGLNLNEASLPEAWNSAPVREARLNMLRGERVSSCTHCYREEENGCRSHRMTENQVWQQRHSPAEMNERLGRVDATGYLREGIVSLDLRLGNTCNLTCVMCRPQDSSRWTALAKKLSGDLPSASLREEWSAKSCIDASRFEWYKSEEFWTDLRAMLPTMRELIIGGGEPMLLTEHRRLLDECVRSGFASQMQIRYHTNGTILDEEIFELWREFRLVEVYVSLDGIGERNTYMRHPASWPTIDRNLRRLDSYPFGNLQVMLLCSVHMMSVFYLDEYAAWIEKQNFRLVTHGFNGYFHPGVVHFPSYMSVQVLPPSIKKIVQEKIAAFEDISQRPSVKIGGIVNFMNELDQSSLLPLTLDYIKGLDRARGTDFAKALPELAAALKVASPSRAPSSALDRAF